MSTICPDCMAVLKEQIRFQHRARRWLYAATALNLASCVVQFAIGYLAIGYLRYCR